MIAALITLVLGVGLASAKQRVPERQLLRTERRLHDGVLYVVDIATDGRPYAGPTQTARLGRSVLMPPSGGPLLLRLW